MKLGVSSYSFNKLIKKGIIDIFDAIEIAKEIGFDYIELVDLPVVEGGNIFKLAEEIAEACYDVGIGVSHYTVWADFINGSGSDIAAEVERVKKLVDVARILGAKGVRHDATWGFKDFSRGRNFDDALTIMVEGIREVTEYAATFGIKTMCENHGFFAQDSERMEKLVLAVDHENFGLLVDIGNFICADEDPIRAVSRVAPYAFHVHAKDFLMKQGVEPSPGEGWFRTRGGNHIRGTIVGHGIIPIAQCISILKNANYMGIISLEFEGLEDTMDAIRMGYDYLRKCS